MSDQEAKQKAQQHYSHKNIIDFEPTHLKQKDKEKMEKKRTAIFKKMTKL